jgi:ABC-type multidrug transport system fused ATPase/permease subunit
MNGNILEEGTHDELLKLQGVYYEFMQNQINV